MSRGTHAAGDGSFGRSAGNAGLRGLALIVVAIVIGVVLLNRAGSAGTGLSTVRQTSPTTAKPKKGHGTTTTTATPGALTTTTSPTRSPGTIRTLVANSTSVAGQAGRYTKVVHGFGYNTLPAVDSSVRNLRTSIVYYAPGFNAEAAVLARKLGLPKSSVLPMPATPPVVFINGASVLVVVGLDLANATSAAGGTPSATTTTVVRQAPATTAPARTTTTVHH